MDYPGLYRCLGSAPGSGVCGGGVLTPRDVRRIWRSHGPVVVPPFAAMPDPKPQPNRGQMLWCRSCESGWDQRQGGDRCWLCGELGHLRLVPEKKAAA